MMKMKHRWKIEYEGTETSDEPSGSFTVMGETRSYTVSYTGSNEGGTQITNTVQDTVSYEAIKEWNDVESEEITLQIFRAVTGEEFDYSKAYLEFTMNGTTSSESAKIVGSKPADAPNVDVTWGISNFNPENTDTLTEWPAVVSGLPAFDDEGRTYEYILLEKTDGDNTPVYHNVETTTAAYRTIVVNGEGSGGFNLLVRKVWLDNSDTPHRDPVTFTLYNMHTNQPIMKKNSDGTASDDPYTLTLGGEDAPGIWSSVFWISPSELDADSIADDGDDNTFNADDVYLVETSVGTANEVTGQGKVDHHEEESYGTSQNTEKISYHYLYRDRDEGEPIFDVTTANHRYQVTYAAEYEIASGANKGSLPGGVGAAFTITNRRLGYINLKVTKSWVDGRTTVLDDDGNPGNNPTLSDEIADELEKIYNNGKGRKLALVFRLVFDDSMGNTAEKGWNITYSGPSAQLDMVCVGGEKLPIYHEYNDESRQYSDLTSTEQVIIGWGKDPNDPSHEEAVITSNETHFYGLPKYDSTGTAVAYSVEEIWLDVTDASSEKAPRKITDQEMAEEYPALYELWSGYTEPQFKWTYENNVNNMQHTLDKQDLHVTNQRGTPKNITWTKVWEDAYTNESGLRPDLYLDIYRVVHVEVDDATGVTPDEPGWIPTYERRIEYVRSSGDWEKKLDDKTWTLTLNNVKAFDEYGFAIYYYAVERTQQPADLYDYQAGEYFLNGMLLGTRDEPLDTADILSSETTPQETGDYAYDLLVLGRRADGSSDVDSIDWNGSGQPTGIGTFGEANGYPQYALIENGTFTNTLAAGYSIDGMKYWTNLPINWQETHALPTIQFLVYRYAKSQVGTGSDWLDQAIRNADGTYKTDGTDGTGETEYYAAQLTINSGDWEKLKSGTGYRYLIQYNGVNKLTIEDDVLTCKGDGAPLERYNENGELYIYEIREAVQWPAQNADAELEDVFSISQAANGFYITNRYTPDTGEIRVKKFLYLPMTKDAEGNDVPEAYPAVTFRLERWLQKADSTDYAKDGWSQDCILTSADVSGSWAASDKPYSRTDEDDGLTVTGYKGTGNYIIATLTLDGLPIYAPDGTEYQYSVCEVKSALNGYDTWGVSGDVTENEVTSIFTESTKLTGSITAAIKGLKPEKNDTTVDASFKNQQPDKPATHSSFAATKIWEDNNSSFRPLAVDFTKLLILTRTAPKQNVTGGAAAMETETLVLGTDYTIDIKPEDGTEDSTWTITITPVGTGEFEKYAPNGMAWIYSLKERTDNGRLQLYQAGEGEILTDTQQQANKVYTPKPGTGTWPSQVTATSQTSNFGSLTNSTLTHVEFQKVWEGENGQLTEDYLGFDLTVEFQLQVREMDGDEEGWVDAAAWTYDGGKTLGLSGRDTGSLTGKVVGADHNWSYTFDDLHGVVQKEDKTYIFLEYRVIETKVSWGNGADQNQAVSLPTGEVANDDAFTYDVTGSLVTGATFRRSDNTSTTTNKLETTSVSVEKVWDDTNNQYGTRPGAEGPWTWASWFVLRRSTDGTTWKNVALFQKLFGSNAESGDEDGVRPQEKWSDEITGLPTTNYQTGDPYIYQVRELQPNENGYTKLDQVMGNLVEETDPYGEYGYKAHYAASDDSGHGIGQWTVTNTLRDEPTGGLPRNIQVTKVWAGNEIVGSVTFQLKYTTANTQTPQLVPSNLVPERTVTATNLTVTWTDLPDTINNESVTGYLVEEKAGSGWVQIGQPRVDYNQDTGTTTYFYTFTNSAVTSYSVAKEWNPAGTATAPVNLGLYRTTVTAAVGSISGAPVPINELDSTQGARKVTLDGTVDETETTAWTVTFANLPKYDTSGRTYYYYALELDGSGSPIAQNGKITLNSSDYEVTYDWKTDEAKTTVTNTTTTNLAGTKTWRDNSNAYGTRSDTLTLILERKVEGEDWVNVSSLYQPTWDKTIHASENEWTYTYTGLPTCDESGKPYEYRVRESIPDGYELTNRVNGGAVGEVEKTDGSYDFTNRVTGTVTITGRKFWSGGVGTTPTLKLERKTANTDWTDITGTVGQPTWSDNTSDSMQWTFTYANLPEYDAAGVLYQYRVRETGPDGYEASYKTETISSSPAVSVDGLIITNYKDGDLTISKTVSGNKSDPNRDFTFIVTLTGKSSAGTEADTIQKTCTTTRTNADGTTTSGSITFTGGVSTEFTLKHNESLTIQGLPAGIGYTVIECEANQDGYSTTGTGWSGTIPAGGTAEAGFSNYNHDSGGGGGEERMNLTGRKLWIDKGENDPNRPENITLELYRKIPGGTEERVYAKPTWVKNGNTWTYTFTGLPKVDENGNEYAYWVREDVPEGYTASQSGNNITNRSTEVEPGALQVRKRVTGSGGDPTREFTFIVTLSNQNLTGTYGQMTFVNGVATFTLRDGESILAENLPAGTTYTVTEREANQGGYTTTATGDTGVIAASITASAAFTNYRPGADPDPTPDVDPNPDPDSEPEQPDTPDDPNQPDNPEGHDVPTGDENNLALYGALAILFMVGLSITLYLGKKPDRRKGGKRLMR